MTYLRSVPSDFDNVFQLPPRVRAPSSQPAGDGTPTPAAAHLGLTTTVLRYWRQTAEARRARHQLMQLNDHLLRDIGLGRTDVCFGDVELLARHRAAGGIL